MTNCVGITPCKCLIRCGAGQAGGYRERGFLLGWNQCALAAVHRLGFWAAANQKPAKIHKSAESQPLCESSPTLRHKHAVMLKGMCCVTAIYMWDIMFAHKIKHKQTLCLFAMFVIVTSCKQEQCHVYQWTLERFIRFLTLDRFRVTMCTCS